MKVKKPQTEKNQNQKKKKVKPMENTRRKKREQATKKCAARPDPRAKGEGQKSPKNQT